MVRGFKEPADMNVSKTSMQNLRVFLACMLFTGNIVCIGTWIWVFLHYPIILCEPDPMIWSFEVLGFMFIVLGDIIVFIRYLRGYSSK